MAEGNANVMVEDRIHTTLFPQPARACTRSFSYFIDEYRKHTEFFFFLITITSRIDESRSQAAKTLARIADSPEDKEKYEKSAHDDNVVLRQLQEHRITVSQNLVNGIVNAFQRYFSEIVSQACQKRPEILSSAKQIKLEDVMKHSTRRDLISFIVDRQVNELSYGGVGDLRDFFQDRLGIELFENKEQMEMLRIFFEVRNINVHNGGIANSVFAARVKPSEHLSYTVGDQIHFDLDDIVRFSANAWSVAQSVDERVSSKFRLQTKKHKTWQRSD